MRSRLAKILTAILLLQACGSGSIFPERKEEYRPPSYVDSYRAPLTGAFLDGVSVESFLERGYQLFALSQKSQEDVLLLPPRMESKVVFVSRAVQNSTHSIFGLDFEDHADVSVRIVGTITARGPCENPALTCITLKVNLAKLSGDEEMGQVSRSYKENSTVTLSYDPIARILSVDSALEYKDSFRRVGLAQVTLPTDSWQNLPDAPKELIRAEAVALGKYFYLAGFARYTKKFHVYGFDPNTSVWAELPSAPQPETMAFAMSAIKDQNGLAITFSGADVSWLPVPEVEPAKMINTGTWGTGFHEISPLESPIEKITSTVCKGFLYQLHWSQVEDETSPNYFLAVRNLNTKTTTQLPKIPSRTHAPKDLELLCVGQNLLVWFRGNLQWNFVFYPDGWRWADSPPEPIYSPDEEVEGLLKVDRNRDQSIYRTSDSIIHAGRDYLYLEEGTHYRCYGHKEVHLNSGEKLENPLPLMLETRSTHHSRSGTVFWGHPIYKEGRMVRQRPFGYYLNNSDKRLYILPEHKSSPFGYTHPASAFNGNELFVWGGCSRADQAGCLEHKFGGKILLIK